jgi:glucose/arabinose dehydrogenase
MLRVLKFLLIFFVVILASYFLFKIQIENFVLRYFMSSGTGTSFSNLKTNGQDIEIIAENLEVPWEVVFLPNQDMLVTLRKGELLVYRNKEIISRFNIEGVNSEGEGGLLGIAVHPDYEQNKFIYLYYTSKNNRNFENKIERFKLTNNNLEKDRLILKDIRGNIYHNAGKIAFGPDNYLYVTAGDALDEPLAQNKSVLAGKILRIDSEGKFPKENPFNNEVYSYGHRNPQGLSWDNEGKLWSTEHGQSGLNSGQDELNKIKIGSNYGWPVARGSQEFSSYISPIIQSGDKITWAPGDTEYYAGNIFFTGLRGAGIYKYDILGKNLSKFLENDFGRLRAITLGPDGYFYVTTSNRDGRGSPKDSDDKILRINPKIFFNEPVDIK